MLLFNQSIKKQHHFNQNNVVFNQSIKKQYYFNQYDVIIFYYFKSTIQFFFFFLSGTLSIGCDIIFTSSSSSVSLLYSEV
jgi:hypothetical protein